MDCLAWAQMEKQHGYMRICQALFPSQLCCSPQAAVTLPLAAPFLALWLMYNSFCQDPASTTSSKFPPLSEMGCLLGCSLVKCTLELLQAEKDLILRFPWAGTLNHYVALTKKNPHGCAMPTTSSIIARACFQRAWPCLSSAGSQMPSVGVRCALGTGNGMGPEGVGLRAASFLHPALPSTGTQSHVGCAASGPAVKQSWRCPGRVRTSLWAQADALGCTESSWISDLEAGGCLTCPVTQPVYTPTASLHFNSCIQCSAWIIFWAFCHCLECSVIYFFFLLNPLGSCPFFPAMVPSAWALHTLFSVGIFSPYSSPADWPAWAWQDTLVVWPEVVLPLQLLK